MIQMDLPFHFRIEEHVRWKPVVVRDEFGTEIWFLRFYLAINI
jgi:hypothetical protein